MRLDAITLEHFRNYAHQSVTFDPSVNVIVGENAQGKTNLLEAAVYLSCAKSPRARTEKEMISFDADTARLTGSVFSRGRDFTVEIELFRGKRRKMSVNQVPCKRAGDLSGVLNTVYFCPDDLLLIRDGAAARAFSSQGQTRTAALSLKLAERDIFRELTGFSPVLLLDDVLSELDPRRQEFVLNRISGGQVFITCCEEDRLETLLGGKVLHVENGKVV